MASTGAAGSVCVAAAAAVRDGGVGGHERKPRAAQALVAQHAAACRARRRPMPSPRSPVTSRPEMAEPTPWPKMGLKVAAASAPSRSRSLNHASATTAGVFMKAGEASAARHWPRKSTAKPSWGEASRRSASASHRSKVPITWSAQATKTAARRLADAKTFEHNQEPGRKSTVLTVGNAVIAAFGTENLLAVASVTGAKVSHIAWLNKPSSM
mmetsp:Transcript_87491/g.283274  ORF Transcript_87491/g.283274 Transcript_87491/m.283274 type:complete len:212 (-) Transcript_87491:203-838(-)